MKVFRYITLCFVCITMISCGTNGDNLESYKNQYLNQLAKEMGTTKDYLLKDLDIAIDSMKIIPITVADSIKILEEASADDGKNLKKAKSELAKIRQMESLITLFGGSDEKVKEAMALLKEMPSEISNIEKAISENLPKYKEMKETQVLAKVLSFQIATLDTKSRVHKVEKRKAVFTKNGELVRTKCPIFLEAYLNDKAKQTKE